MKQFFEGFRRWSTLNEEQLLAEGRLEDVKKKFKHVDPDWIHLMSGRDPSGNNKYLMWAIKQFAKITDPYREKAQAQSDDRGGHMHPDDAAAMGHAAYEAYRVTADAVEKFHANSQRLKNKDINAYKTIDDVIAAVKKLGLTQRQKKRKKREAAREGSTNLFENDDFWMIRPDTEEASCYYGQETKWCISATQGRNYFKSYTSEGKTFYMIMMKGLDVDDTGRKVALVYARPEGFDGYEPEEIYDAPDDLIDEEDFLALVIKNLIGAHFADYEKVYDEVEEFHADPSEENFTENIKKLAEEMEKSGDYETEIDVEDIKAPHPEELEEAMRMTFHNVVNELFSIASHHNDENPGGPSAQDYQDLLDAHEYSYVHVHFDEYDEGQYYWQASTSWEFHGDIEYSKSEDGEETDFSDWADDIEQIFKDVADNNYVYPTETDYSDYSDSRIDFRFDPDHGEQSGLEGFEAFLNSMDEVESAYETIEEEALEAMREAGITTSEEHDRKVEQFRKKYINKFENFDVTLEKGKIDFHQKEEYVVQMPLFRTLGGPELRRVEPRSAGQKIASSPERDQYFKDTVGYLNTLTIKAQALKHAFDKTWPLAYDRSKEMQKQFEFSLTEIHLYGDYKDQVQLEFTEYLVDLENGGELGAAVRLFRVATDDARGLAYADWLDENLDTFYDAVAEFILKTAHETRVHQGRANPGKFEAGRKLGFEAEGSEEQVSENVSYGKLCENWKRWAGK